jgi:spore maturation protein CgeB
MKVLILNTDYPAFLTSLYGDDSSLKDQPYEVQMRARNESLFGVADFYSSNLRRLGHEAFDIHFNNRFMQTEWAREHGFQVKQTSEWRIRMRRGLVPWLSRANTDRYLYGILESQIRYYRPDVILNQAVDGIDPKFLLEMKPRVRLMVGQIAAPLPIEVEFGSYDLMLSSLPNFVERFRASGMQSEHQNLAFEPSVRSRLRPHGDSIEVSFVGSLSQAHRSRVSLLEQLCSRTNIRVWANGVDSLPSDSPIRPRHAGVVWGREMYQVLNRSRISINHHIGISEQYANNMRLFEATGVGTLLITDWKSNLSSLFSLNSEIVTYRSAEECSELIQYYVEHEEQRRAIADAGQKRTMSAHTYELRARELANIFTRFMNRNFTALGSRYAHTV